MSTSTSTPSTTYQPTRQQLDELDALLQRMLELPVNQIDETALQGPTSAGKRKAAAGSTGKAEKSREPAAIVPPPEAKKEVVSTQSPDLAPRIAIAEMAAEAEALEHQQKPAISSFLPEEPPADLAIEEQASLPPDIAEVEEPASASTALEPAPEVSALEDAEEWVPLRSSWKPTEQTWPPLAEHWQQAHVRAPITPSSEYAPTPDVQPAARPELTAAPPGPSWGPAAAPASEEQEMAGATAGDEPASWLLGPVQPAAPEPLSVEHPAEAPWVLLPLVWFNQGFDSCVQPLGLPGRWLASSAGKAVLGGLGVVSLAAAIVLAVGDRIGWTW